MGKTPPAFQFYYKDFMDAVTLWDARACGVYIRMLCTQYSQGGLPDDLDALERAVGKEVREVWVQVSEKFPICKDGFRRNARLEEVRSAQDEFRKSRQKAAKTRWGKGKKVGASAHAHASTNAHTHAVHIEDGDRSIVSQEGKERTRKVLFANSRYVDPELARAELPDLVAEGVNFPALRDSIRNWSDAKDEKRSDRGWLATYRTFHQRDKERGAKGALRPTAPAPETVFKAGY